MNAISRLYRSIRTGIAQNRLEAGLVAAIMIFAALVRLVLIASRPGWELDEAVYARITENFNRTGSVFLIDGTPYLSHPPFYFHVLGAWFRAVGSGIGAGRVLAALCQLGAMLIIYAAMRSIAGWRAALVALLLVAGDGWLIFTARIGWMENSLLILIGLMLLAYARAIRSDRQSMYAVSGAFLGAAIVYKHVGGFLLLFALLAWLLGGRKSGRRYAVLVGAALAVVALYVGSMYAVWGNIYLRQSWQQVLRTFGVVYSPGLNYGIGDILAAIGTRYWMFFTTVAAFLLGVPYTLAAGYRALRGRFAGNRTLLALSLAAIGFFGVISLKSPHYFILLLVPLYCFLGSEVLRFKLAPRASRVMVPTAAVAFAALSLLTWNLRFAAKHDNLLASVQAYASSELPLDAAIFSTEPVCSVIPQQACVKLEGKSTDEIKQSIGRADIVLLYESTTLHFPAIPGEVLATFEGFKDKVTVIRMPRAGAAR